MVGFKRVKQLALEAICTTDLRDVEAVEEPLDYKAKTRNQNNCTADIADTAQK
jgi:hypothetical protein